jgi:hypothetical protein
LLLSGSTYRRARRSALNGRRVPARSSRALAAVLVLLFSLSMLFIVGCGGGNAVKSYLDVAQPVLDTVAARYAKLRQFASVSLAERGGMDQAVLDMRKAIADGQDKLDTTHAPPDCEDLDATLRKYLDTGRDMCDIITGYADYESAMAPVAASTGELVQLITQVSSQNDISSEMTGLLSKAAGVTASFQTVQSTPSFDEVHRQFFSFIQNVTALLDQQSGKVNSQSATQDNNNYDNNYQSSSSPASREKNKKQAVGALDDVPQQWSDLNSQISSAEEAMLMGSTFKIKNDEFLAEADLAVKQIAELRKKYNAPLPTPKK